MIQLSDGHFRSLKFKNLTSLKKLLLGNLNFKTLNNILQCSLFPGLEYLDLSQNQLRTLNTSYFSQLPLLRTLYMSHNMITTIEIVNIKSLLTLDRLKFIVAGTLYSRFMTDIDLRNNQLDFVSLDDLLRDSVLANVFFSNNSISRVDKLIRAPSFINMQLLDLSFNHITELNLKNVESEREDVKTRINFE